MAYINDTEVEVTTNNIGKELAVAFFECGGNVLCYLSPDEELYLDRETLPNGRDSLLGTASIGTKLAFAASQEIVKKCNGWVLNSNYNDRHFNLSGSIRPNNDSDL